MSLQKKSFLPVVPILRFCASGVTAVILLNLIFSFYYRLPLHHDNPLGTTDYVWEANAAWIKLTEGISWGRMDANGFNNCAVVEKPDVLILGSSHMEATNVRQSENTANRLQAHLKERCSDFSVYNRGISGHHFLKCVKYLSENAKAESVPYIAIETSKIDFTAEEIARLFSGTIDVTPSYSTGVLFYLQKLPLFRLFYFQLEQGLLNLFLPQKSKIVAVSNAPQPVETTTYEKLFSYIAENANEKRVIIFYHPTGTPDANGNLMYDTDGDYLSAFSSAANAHGISFIDLTAATDDLWQSEHKTTHGFCTGTAFSGHLNKNGHALAAKALAEEILALEQERTQKEKHDVTLVPIYFSSYFS